MARIRNLNQKAGSLGNNMLYETLTRIQGSLGQVSRQGRLAGTEIQASSTVYVNNPVIRVSGTATVNTINAQDFGTPVYFYALNGFSFGTQGGNIANEVILQAEEGAIAQFDASKGQWFIFSGAGGLASLANIGGGAEVFKNIVWPTAFLRTLLGAGATTVTQNANDITISSPAATVTALANVGTGSEVYKGMSGTTAQLRKVNAGAGISVTQNADDVTVANTAPHVAQTLTYKQIAYGDAGNLVTSEAPFRREVEGGLNVIMADNFWTKRAPVINVKWFGATGNGGTDDTDAIQAAIDYATTIGGTVYFPAGSYMIGRTAGTGLFHKAGVSYRGEGGSRYSGSHLQWRPYTAGAVVDVGGVILDTTHIDIAHASIENLYFTKHADVATGKVTGILGGCYTGPPTNPADPLEYNSGSVVFRDLLFYALEYGIRGNGAGYDTAGNRTIGFFDSVFDNVGYASCEYGVLTGGSGNVHLRPHFGGCTVGALVMDYISAESFSGENVFGGTWSQNKNDIYFTDGGGGAFEQYRQTNFFASWFEASTHGIIGYDVSIGGNVIIPVLNFQGCVLDTTAQAGVTGFLVDGTKIKGRLNVNECAIYKFAAAYNDQVLGGADTKLMIRDCIQFNTAGIATYTGTDAGMMLIKAAAPAAGNILAAATTVLVWDVVGATPGMEDFDRETCFDGTSTYTAKYSDTHRVSVNVMLDAFPVTESVDLRISKNATVVAIHHQNGTGYDISMSIEALVSMAVNDTLTVSIYNPDVAAKTQIIGTYGFTNPHYNTFKVTREF